MPPVPVGGRITVERPKFRKRRADEGIDVLDGRSRKLADRFPLDAAGNLSWDLHRYSDSEPTRFRRRSVRDPEGRDPRQAEALELASCYYSAAFAVAAPPAAHAAVSRPGGQRSWERGRARTGRPTARLAEWPARSRFTPGAGSRRPRRRAGRSGRTGGPGGWRPAPGPSRRGRRG
ncbi:hypothetical protein GCM10009605_09000 [Nocardiopsis composta]